MLDRRAAGPGCSTVARVGTSKGERRRAQWEAREAAYWQVVDARARQERGLGSAVGEPAPSPTGSAREEPRRGKRRREKRPGAQLPDVRPRAVSCPRCLARVGASCRNGRGEAVGAHADRKRKAAEEGKRTPRQVVERRQLAQYREGAAAAGAGQGRNGMDEFFAARRDAATTRGRSEVRQRRIDGL